MSIAPLPPRFRLPWSFLAAFITGGAQFYHRQYLIVAVEFFILGTFYEFYAWPKKSLLWLIEVGPKVSLKGVLYIQISFLRSKIIKICFKDSFFVSVRLENELSPWPRVSAMRIFETNSRLKAAIISYLGQSQKCLQQVKFQRVKELNLFAFNYIFDIPYQLPYYFRVECATWLPETREPKKKSVKAGTGRGRIEIFRLQVSRTRPEEV